MGAILDIIGSYIFKAAMLGIIFATSYSLNEVMTKKAQQTNPADIELAIKRLKEWKNGQSN